MTTEICYVTVLYIRSLIHVSVNQNQDVDRAAFFSGGSGGESISLPFPASLARGPLAPSLEPAMLHLSDHSFIVISPSDSKLNWEKFPIFFFCLHRVFVAVRGLSLGAVSGGYPSLRCAGFSLQWLLLLRSPGSRRVGFSSCSTLARQLLHTGSKARGLQ